MQLNSDKTVIGGYQNSTLRDGIPAEITVEARQAREQTGGRRWILGPACSVPVDCPEENIRAARTAADNVQSVL
jgi:uroporphyrinogen-III decarboxylase